MGYGGGMLWFLIMGALLVIPFWRLLPRWGIPAWVAFLALVPIGALILLWIIAFKDDITGRPGKA